MKLKIIEILTYNTLLLMKIFGSMVSGLPHFVSGSCMDVGSCGSAVLGGGLESTSVMVLVDKISTDI